MPRALGPRKIGKYPIEFKAKAVALSRLPGLEVRQVAESLGIHPFMLSRWRKEAREGLFTVSGGKLGLHAKQVAELKRLRQVEQENRVLKEELSLLKKLSGSAPNENRDLRLPGAEPGPTPNKRFVPHLQGDPKRLLWLAPATVQPTPNPEPGVVGPNCCHLRCQ